MRRTGALALFFIAAIAATTVAAELPQVARGRGASGSPVAPEKLQALLPTLAGWTRGEPDGEVLNLGMTMSVARVSYEKGDLSMTLEITDTLANQQLMGPFAGAMVKVGGQKQKTETGWARGITLAGFPGAETWEDNIRTATVVVIVNGRFVVKADLADAADTSAPRAAVEAVNLKALAALK